MGLGRMDTVQGVYAVRDLTFPFELAGFERFIHAYPLQSIFHSMQPTIKDALSFIHVIPKPRQHIFVIATP
jgi:hypothetical protein